MGSCVWVAQAVACRFRQNPLGLGLIIKSYQSFRDTRSEAERSGSPLHLFLGGFAALALQRVLVGLGDTQFAQPLKSRVDDGDVVL